MFDSLVKYIETNFDGEATFIKGEHSEDKIAESILKLTNQLIIADNRIVPEELEKAKEIIESNPALSSRANIDEFLSINEEQIPFKKQMPLFHLLFVIRDSLSDADILKLRKHLIELAHADNEYHPNEEQLIDFFDLVTKKKT
jgi:uncharacterized tellurite resistance protein B-like protein